VTVAEQIGVLVMSHGTPPSLDGLLAFYTEIRRGSPPSAVQLADLERRYRSIGGMSPLTARTREQEAGLARALEDIAPGRYLVAGGTKFAQPRIAEALGALATAGVERVTALVLAPHAAEVSVGDYVRRAGDAARALEDKRGAAPAVRVIRHWYDAPGFDELLAERVREAIDSLPADRRHGVEVLFSAHSVPLRTIEGGDTYASQVEASAAGVAAAAELGRWRTCWQSAGRTEEAWLGPDLLGMLAAAAEDSARAVVICPIGFVSDHLEVLYDVDIEARSVAERRGLAFARTRSLNDDPRFCAMLARVVHEASLADTPDTTGTSG
jgi:protoporphyrin/coproporphyrin ferrochelatase